MFLLLAVTKIGIYNVLLINFGAPKMRNEFGLFFFPILLLLKLLLLGFYFWYQLFASFLDSNEAK